MQVIKVSNVKINRNTVTEVTFSKYPKDYGIVVCSTQDKLNIMVGNNLSLTKSGSVKIHKNYVAWTKASKAVKAKTEAKAFAKAVKQNW